MILLGNKATTPRTYASLILTKATFLTAFEQSGCSVRVVTLEDKEKMSDSDFKQFQHTTGFCLPESTRLRVGFHSHKTSDIDVVPVQIFRAGSESSSAGNSPRRWVTTIALSKLKALRYYLRYASHVFLINWRRVGWSLDNFLTLPLLTL